MTDSVVASGGVYRTDMPATHTSSGSTPLADLQMGISVRSMTLLQSHGFAVEQGGRRWVAEYDLTDASWRTRTAQLDAIDFATPSGVDPASQAAVLLVRGAIRGRRRRR